MRFSGFNFWIKWRIIHVWPSSFLSFCLSFRVLSPPRARGFLEARGSCQLRGPADTAGAGGAHPRARVGRPPSVHPPSESLEGGRWGLGTPLSLSPALPFSLDFLLLSSAPFPGSSSAKGAWCAEARVLRAPRGRGFREAGARAGAAGRRRPARARGCADSGAGGRRAVPLGGRTAGPRGRGPARRPQLSPGAFASGCALNRRTAARGRGSRIWVFVGFFFLAKGKGCVCVCVCLWLGELWPVGRTDLFPSTPAPHVPRKGFQVYKRTSPSSPLRASSAPSGPEQPREEGLECVGSRLSSTSISSPPPSQAFCSFRSEK